MHLDEYEEKLRQHFQELSQRRSARHSNWPVFALEHGLDRLEIEGLREAVRNYVTQARPSDRHCLAWVVYATESGYAYSGEEFWQSFEERTPGWAVRGNRNWLRSRFRQFARAYGGAIPSGIWAGHFGIIAWPITHAILPKDLQRHLARTLFNVRNSIRQDHLDDPERLGRLIRSRSEATSGRFQQFTQETVLIGQISTALLLRGDSEAESRILPAAINRIANDLDAVSQAAEWLRQAQATTKYRLKQRRITPKRQSQGELPPTTIEESRSVIAELALEPRLYLSADHPDWRVIVEIPNLNPLIDRFPQLEETLRNSRCRVSGGGRPLARGRVLSGSRRVELDSWPQFGKTLIQFEPSGPNLIDALLRTDCLMRPGTLWLFEYQTDGWAREITSRRVKPGKSYVVVGSGFDPGGNDWFEPIPLNAAGVHAARLSVPSVIDEDFIIEAERLELPVLTEVEMWPAGLTPVSWDGAGRAEWLTTDTPRIGLRSNVELDRFAITITGSDSLTTALPALSEGDSCFVELPSMEAGTFQLSVTASREGDRSFEIGSLAIVMREPQPWTPSIDESGALMVIPDPSTPTIEELWDGNATFHVYAPSSREVNCRLSLFDARADNPFSVTDLPAFTAPADSGEWRKFFGAHLDHVLRTGTAYDRTSRCLLEFSAEGIGAFRIECERQSSPVRWALRDGGHDGFELRLIDDRGSDSEVNLQYFSFRKPEVGRPLEAATFLPAPGAPAEGGLYLAEWGNERQAIIVPEQVSSHGNQGDDPVVQGGLRSKHRASQLLKCIQTWQDAGIRGNFFALRRRINVVNDLLSVLVDGMGKPGWVQAERDFVQDCDPSSIKALEPSVASNADRNLRGRLRHVLERPDWTNRQLRDVCTTWLANQQPSRRLPGPGPGLSRSREATFRPLPRWLAEFALRLVSAPQSLQVWARPHFDAGLDLLFNRPEFLRAARFAVLIVEQELEPDPLDPDVLYTGWDWE